MIRDNKNTILLLNPPGSKMFFRDYYCAKVSKANYYYHPIDFVYLSGRLSNLGEVYVIDAIAERISAEQCRQQIVSLNPDIIIFLSSAPSYNQDISFMQKMSDHLVECKIIATGDIFRDFRKKALVDNSFLDAILLDFSTDDIIKYLKNTSNNTIPNIIYRSTSGIIEGYEKHDIGEWNVPLPLWNKFSFNAYHFPFARRKPFASILTDFGCPFSCDFCPISTLGFKLRPLNDVIEELELLNQLGIKELYIRDQTFGVNKNRTLEFLDRIIELPYKFTWTALSRTDVLDEELLRKMKKAGCHTLMIGIESANEELLQNHKKSIKASETYNTIKRIKNKGIKLGGFFMLGFPGETKESVNETAKLARNLPIDYASFNIVSPRFGTEFRKRAIEQGVVDPESLEAESSASMPVWKNQAYSNEELLELKRKAVSKFYLRPSYLLKRILSVKTWFEFVNLLKEGKALLITNRKSL
jgi:anaerobic magnesium-protoporphyrin IX monomethyl ester cyclase